MGGVKLFSLINKIATGKLERSEQKELIEICCRIGVVCLNKKYHKHKAFFSENGISFFDVAVDSVYPLFIVNEPFNQTVISKSLENWGKEITSASDASFFIHSVVWKRVDQTINHVLGELDPLFSKILTNLSYHIKQNACKKIYYLGQAYLVETGITKIKGTLIDENEFNNVPLELIKNKYDTAINNLFDYIKSSTNHFPAIPLNYFVNRLKNLYVNEIISQNLVEDSLESSYYLNQILKESLERMNLFIDENYTAKNKLSESEGEIFKKALKDIAFDMTSNGISRGIEVYLFPYLTSLTDDEIKKKYHHILDYFYRLLKKDLKNALEHSEFS